MNKAKLIVEIQNHLGTGATKTSAEQSLVAVLEALKVGIAQDGIVQLMGFGTFTITERKARKGVNPQTGEPMDIAASKTIKFKPSAQIKSIC